MKNLHVDSIFFPELLRDDVPFKRTRELEKLFQDNKDRISAKTNLAVPKSKDSFHIHVNSSSIGIRSILVQEFLSGKRTVSVNLRAFTKDYQRITTLHRELCGIISAPSSQEQFITDSPHPIKAFFDYKPLLYICPRKGKFSLHFFCYQLIITQLTSL